MNTKGRWLLCLVAMMLAAAFFMQAAAVFADEADAPRGAGVQIAAQGVDVTTGGAADSARDIEDSRTPEAGAIPVPPEVIAGDSIPLADSSSWPILNLVFMVAGVFIGAAALIARMKPTDNYDSRFDIRMVFKLLGVICAMAGIVFWVLTEDFRGNMSMRDIYTVPQAVILAATLVSAILATALPAPTRRD